ncbi:MAG: hypothetical protein ACRDH5_10455, partial [bacterium]
VLFAAVAPIAAQENGHTEILTNASVIEMVTAKLPKDIILAKLQSTANRFDVSATGLVTLNNAKVPKDLIKAMMAAAAPAAKPEARPAAGTAEVATAPASGEDPGPATSPFVQPARAGAAAAPRSKRRALPLASIPTEPGIYLHASGEEGLELTPLEPTVYSAGKTSGTFVSALTRGIAKARIKAVVRSPEAAIRTEDDLAEFYFVFEKKSSSLSGAGDWFQQLTSPNEFTLVRFEVKNNGREVSTAAVGAFGSEAGTEAKATVPFTLTRLNAGVYRVVPKDVLLPGEYAFIPPSSVQGVGTAGAAGAQRLFDFGVSPR